MTALHLSLTSPDQTAMFARHVAQASAPGLVIALEGPVGAGKSHFARQMIQHLQAPHGPPEDVPSPTFTLVQTYLAGPLEIWHADLYRLSTPDEAIELGLVDAFDGAMCLVEWPDRLGELLPPRALHLTFAHRAEADTRDCTAKTAAPDLARLIEEYSKVAPRVGMDV